MINRTHYDLAREKQDYLDNQARQSAEDAGTTWPPKYVPQVDEAKSWEAEVRVIALARCVLAVARTRIEGAWAAYCDAVPGQSHENEFEEVLRSGCKLPEKYARAIFPRFDDLPYAR